MEIKKIVYGGLGLGHWEGRTVFIPCTAPGDIVTFEVKADKKKVLFGEIDRVVEKSPIRAEPDCPVFGSCGGCHLLHVSYENEIEIKRAAVLESISRILGAGIGADEFISCPERYGYRNNTLFHVDPDGKAGFNRRESGRVVPFPENGCLLLPVPMREAIGAVPAEQLVPGSDVRVRMDSSGNVYFWGLPDQEGPPEVHVEAGEYRFSLPPHSFFQVNRFLTGTLMETVLSLITSRPPKVLDLYSGTGFFSLPVSGKAGEVTGIESDANSHRSAVAAKKLNNVSNVRFVKGRVEKLLFRFQEADMIIADPPRSGIPAEAVKGIVKLRPRAIIMVSCEPPTFARDASRFMDAGYSLKHLHLIDMFPGTYHLELVGLFSE